MGACFDLNFQAYFINDACIKLPRISDYFTSRVKITSGTSIMLFFEISGHFVLLALCTSSLKTLLYSMLARIATDRFSRHAKNFPVLFF